MAKGTVNKVILLGRLGQDPEIRATAAGTQIANLSVATNELGPKDESGMRADQTEWHRCVLFGKQAEVAGQYLAKGSLVYLEGRLQTRKWQDDNGVDRWSTSVVCFEMQMVGGKSDNQQQGAPQQQQQSQQQNQGFQQPQQGNQNMPATINPPAQQTPNGAPAPGFDNFDDDIPF